MSDADLPKVFFASANVAVKVAILQREAKQERRIPPPQCEHWGTPL